MSTISTFSGFTMARLGIMASQKALEVTGNNISNINTEGYTRQALRQKALYIGGADKYASQFDVRVGSGALTTGVSQLRDPYLDIRYRNEMGNVGFQDAKLSILQQLSQIMDEVGKGNEDGGIIEAQLNDILEQLQNMNTEHAGQDDYDALVRSSCQELCNWFQTYAGELETLRNNTQTSLNEEIAEVNNLLSSIRELNEAIKKAEIANGALTEAQKKEGLIGERGSEALELRDERNLLIDKLSNYLPIDVKYSDEPIGSGMYVEKLTISLSGHSDMVLVDGIFSGTLSYQQVPDPANPNKTIDDPALKLQISVLEDRRGEKIPAGRYGSTVNPLDETTLTGGSLQALREMLTRNGEFSTAAEKAADPNAATKRGIPYYQKALDALANKFATEFNKANIAGNDGNGNVLFSIRGDSDLTVDPITGETINASNISIATSWAHGQWHMEPSQLANAPSSANDNIAHFIAIMNKELPYNAQDVVGDAVAGVYFTGTFNGMLGYINSNLGNDTKSTTEVLDNYVAAAEELEISRDSVSGVDLNDEAISMMQYQKSYSAACRLLTTLDEILDKLINGTGVAGR